MEVCHVCIKKFARMTERAVTASTILASTGEITVRDVAVAKWHSNAHLRWFERSELEWYRTQLWLIDVSTQDASDSNIIHSGHRLCPQAHIPSWLTPGLAQQKGRGLIRAFFFTLSPSSLAFCSFLCLAFAIPFISATISLISISFSTSSSSSSY